jgi:hypothetical protein
MRTLVRILKKKESWAGERSRPGTHFIARTG